MTPDQITLITAMAFACGFATALLVVLTIHTARMVSRMEAKAAFKALQGEAQP
ncbi:hypothetical protein [Nostoc phage Nsp-JY21]